MPTDRPLIMLIEAFLKAHAMPPTRFGRLAVNDPRFVLDLRLGREPGSTVRCRVEHFMNKQQIGPRGLARGAAQCATVAAAARSDAQVAACVTRQ